MCTPSILILVVVLGSRPVFVKIVVARPRGRRWTRLPLASAPVPHDTAIILVASFLTSLLTAARRLSSPRFSRSLAARLHSSPAAD